MDDARWPKLRIWWRRARWVLLTFALVALTWPLTRVSCARIEPGRAACVVERRALVGLVYDSERYGSVASAVLVPSEGFRLLDERGGEVYARLERDSISSWSEPIVVGVNRLTSGDSSASFAAWQPELGTIFFALVFLGVGLRLSMPEAWSSGKSRFDAD